MNYILRSFYILSFTLLIACGDTSTKQAANEPASIEDLKAAEANENKTIDYQALAEAYCKCSEHTVAINDKMKQLMDISDTAELEKLYPKADKAFKKAIACCKKAKEKQTLGEVDKSILVKPLKKTCPDLPTQLVMKILITDIK